MDALLTHHLEFTTEHERNKFRFIYKPIKTKYTPNYKQLIYPTTRHFSTD